MKRRYIFSAVAILITAVFVMMGCGSSSNIGSDNNGSDDNGLIGSDNDSDWGVPYKQSRPVVADTMKLSFLVAGDPQPDVVHYYNNDTDRIMRIRGTVNYMNATCWEDSCIGAVLVGDLTEHSCNQEVIAFRQMFEDSYPGHDGGTILEAANDYERYSGGSKFKKAVFPLIGNHDDPTHGHYLCDWDASCSTRSSEKCHSSFVQDYIRARVGGSSSLYDVSKLLNSDGLNYLSYGSGDIYAWEWGSYHFINTGLWAGYKGYDSNNNAQHETDTAKLNDFKVYLEMNIGDSGKPVLIFQHYGWTGWNFTDGWWTEDNAADLINVLCRRENTEDTCNPYNVIGIFSGHIHETAYRSIYAGTDKDGNDVTFDNYLVNDAGPGDKDLDITGFFKVELDYNKETSKGSMTIWEASLDWNSANIASASTKLYTSKEFNIPVIDWEQGEPNNAYGTESCAEVTSKGRFYDLDCDQSRIIACRRRDTGELFLSYHHAWSVAQATCDAIGMDFARLTTSAEQREFIDLYKSESRAEPVWVNARSPWVYKADLPINIGDSNDDTEGAGITMADIDGNGKADLIELHILDQNNDDGLANYSYYTIGWNPDKDGKTTNWSSTVISGGTSFITQGGGITAGLINDNNITDLVMFYIIDNPSGRNLSFYRIGWDIDKAGYVSNWSDIMMVPGGLNGGEYFYTDTSAGGGVAIGDINNNGIPDLVFYVISVNPDGLNKGKFRIGLDINSTGAIANNKWTGLWWDNDFRLTSLNNMGGGVSLADIDGNGQLDLISYFIEDRGNDYPNYAYYDIGWNLSSCDLVYCPTSTTRHRANTDVGNITRYGGIVIGDIDGSDRPDLIMANVMGAHPNKFRYAVARNLNKKGELVTQHLDENGTLVPGN